MYRTVQFTVFTFIGIYRDEYFLENLQILPFTLKNIRQKKKF